MCMRNETPTTTESMTVFALYCRHEVVPYVAVVVKRPRVLQPRPRDACACGAIGVICFSSFSRSGDFPT